MFCSFSEISEICFVIETKGKDFKPCIFPFKYGGATYKTCTNVKDPDEKPWCSTKVDADGKHVHPGGYWGHCGQDCDQTALKAQAESSNSAAIGGKQKLFIQVLSTSLLFAVLAIR